MTRHDPTGRLMRQAEKQLRASMPLALDGGLRIRFATPEDLEPHLALVGRVWPDWPGVKATVRELLDGAHPKVDHRDHLLVEEASSSRLVSFMCLISRQWRYGHVPFGVGHVEAIGTDPDFRQQGLVRRQFELIHRLSAAREEPLQVISGLPWYYRQFGYTYALRSFGGGSWQVPVAKIAKLADGAVEPYRLRPLAAADQPLVRLLYQQCMDRGILAAIKDDAYWDFLFSQRKQNSAFDLSWRIISDAAGRAIGCLAILWPADGAAVTLLELAEGHAYLQVMPSVLRQLAGVDGNKPARGVNLALPRNHPVGQAMPPVTRHGNPAQALYLRIPDVVAFLRQIRPALEANLMGTAAEGYTGELKVNCVKWGVAFQFKSGRILAIEPWLGKGLERIHHRPRFVDDTFIQLIGGFRRCAQLMEAHPDCHIDPPEAVLLEAMFPPFYGGLWFNGL